MDATIVTAELAKITQAVGVLSAIDSGESSMKRMKADFQGYFAAVPEGVTISWCGGTLDRLAGSAIYNPPAGKGIPFTPASDLGLLYASPLVKIRWDADYPGAFQFFEAIEAIRLAVKAISAQLTEAPPVVPPVVPPVLPPPSTAKLVWQTLKGEAIRLALAQGKKVLLLGGRESCETTKGMRDIACESIEPAFPIKTLIQQHFIPWYGNSDLNTEYYFYMAPGVEYILPAIRVIDPKNPGISIPISEGNQNFVMIYNKMLLNI